MRNEPQCGFVVGCFHRSADRKIRHPATARTPCEFSGGPVDRLTGGPQLPLRDLESLTRFRPTRFLALHRAGVAREKSEIAQLATMRLVDLHQRSGDREAKGARLPG